MGFWYGLTVEDPRAPFTSRNTVATEERKRVDPFKRQVGGSHYQEFAIQPAEYAEKNELSFLEGTVVKYVSRWRRKGGVDDLRKAMHCIELLIALDLESTAQSDDE